MLGTESPKWRVLWLGRAERRGGSVSTVSKSKGYWEEKVRAGGAEGLLPGSSRVACILLVATGEGQGDMQDGYDRNRVRI